VKLRSVGTWARAMKQLAVGVEDIRASKPGGFYKARNDAAYVVGRYVGGGYLDPVRAERELLAAAVAAGHTYADAQRDISKALADGMKKPVDLDFFERHGIVAPPAAAVEDTNDPEFLARAQARIERFLTEGDAALGSDVINAERLVDEYGDRLRYVKPWGAWLVWDGRRWARDARGEALRLAATLRTLIVAELLAVVRGLPKPEARGLVTAKTQEKMQAAITRAASRGAIEAALALASTDPKVARLPSDFDRDGYLLNVANGTLDLRTGELRPHDRQDNITKLVPYPYVAGAACPKFEAFLARFLPSATLREYVRRLCGYALTGDVGEQALFFFHGKGANGKSTLLNVLLAVLGEYGKAAAPDLLLAKRGEAHPTEQADLEGARLVVCQEVEAGRQWAESTIKQLTGGDRIKARYMRCDFFEFEPTHKIIVSANHKPKVRGQDHAIWRRIKLTPFGVKISEAEKRIHYDKELLAEEAPGILAWAVAGCRAWQGGGLGEPFTVEVADRYDVIPGTMPIRTRHSIAFTLAKEHASPQVTLEEKVLAAVKKAGAVGLSKNGIFRAVGGKCDLILAVPLGVLEEARRIINIGTSAKPRYIIARAEVQS